MSRKYTPTFLKDQQNATAVPSNTETTTRSFWPGSKTEKPLVNTSRPAMEAPKLEPATLAQLTSNGSVPPIVSGGGGGPKQSYAARFGQQAKVAADPNYVPPPKPIDLTSEDDFPSLGAPAIPKASAPRKPENTVIEAPKAPGGASFADLAKSWARKKEDEEEAERRRVMREEQRRREAERIRRTIPLISIRRRQHDFEEDEEDDYNPTYEDNSLGESDSYEMPDDDDQPPTEEEEDEEGEFNQNVGWDGRKRDDLY